jgi:predicted nucleic acid-binding protein
MSWVIDTNVLLDIALPDPTWVRASVDAVNTAAGAGLVVCPITLIELTPQFDSDVGNVIAFLETIGIDAHVPWLEADTLIASAAWASYVEAKRAKRATRRPVADLMIGAFAMRHTGLITRNADDLRPWFPKLKLVIPA